MHQVYFATNRSRKLWFFRYICAIMKPKISKEGHRILKDTTLLNAVVNAIVSNSDAFASGQSIAVETPNADTKYKVFISRSTTK